MTEVERAEAVKAQRLQAWIKALEARKANHTRETVAAEREAHKLYQKADWWVLCARGRAK